MVPDSTQAPLRGPGNVLHASFHQPALVRLLADWAPADSAAPGGDLAERLGHWLNVADAITLRSALQAVPAVASARAARAPGAAPDLAAELQRQRSTLSASLSANDEPPEPEFALHHQRYLMGQRRMEMAIDALREHVRQTLARTSPRLAQLAALDAVLDQMLGGREQHLLASVPVFLKQRFEQRRREQAADAPDAPADAWLQAFAQDCRAAALAELDLRLQPVTGLVEAFQQETVFSA